MSNAVGKVLGLINNLPRFISDKVGTVLMGSVDGDCVIGEARYGRFSGNLIRADVAVRVCCRDDFFLDQAYFDILELENSDASCSALIVGLLMLGWV